MKWFAQILIALSLLVLVLLSISFIKYRQQTMNFLFEEKDYGLIRQLPPLPESGKISTAAARNVLAVYVDKDKLLVAGEEIDIRQLRSKVKWFLNIEHNGEQFPEKEPENLPFLGTIVKNKAAMISLHNDPDARYKTYVQVQIELLEAIHELRNEFSLQKFGVKFDDLSKETQKVVEKVYPICISDGAK